MPLNYPNLDKIWLSLLALKLYSSMYSEFRPMAAYSLVLRITRSAVLLAVPFACFGQWNWFASDAAHLSLTEIRQFLQIICREDFTANGCDACPEGTAFAHEGRLDLDAVIFGHFLSPTSQDALASSHGCEPHSSSNGGSYLFTHSVKGWRIVNYASGRIADRCKKLKGSDGRDLLICGSGDQHQGVGDLFLYLLDPRVSNFEGQELDTFFMVLDSLGSCTVLQNGQVQSGKIEQVVFAHTLDTGAVTIIVDARLGQAVFPEGSLSDCEERKKPGEELLQPRVRTERRRYQFAFDGKSVKPLASNPPMHGFEAMPPQTTAILPTVFQAADNSFAITVPASFRVFTGAGLRHVAELSFIPVCEKTDLACFVYPAERYKRTNFSAAAVAVRTVDAMDEASCTTFRQLPESAVLTPSSPMPVRWIGNLQWAHGIWIGVAFGRMMASEAYRTWHANKCWELSTNITQTNMDPQPPVPFTQEDEKRVSAQLDAVLREFRFLK